MLAALLIFSTVSGIPPFAELQGLEQQIEALEQERDQARARSQIAEVGKLDERLDLLRRAHGRAATIIARRFDRCLERLGRDAAAKPPGRLGPEQEQTQRTLVCAGAAQGVVQRVLRSEEIRQEIDRTSWNYGNVERKHALEEELERLERGL